MSLKCSKGFIVRNGYVRKDGTRVKPSCIIDRGNLGKGPKLIGKLRQGTLTKYGYHSTDPLATRHRSLVKAISVYGPTTVILKLNAICILNKNTNPKISKIFCTDKRWVMSRTRSLKALGLKK
jgi:hypothetical protein